MRRRSTKDYVSNKLWLSAFHRRAMLRKASFRRLAQAAHAIYEWKTRRTRCRSRPGARIRVNTYTTNSQRNPSVAMDSAGNFVVVWESSGQDGSSSGIFGQRVDAAGVLLGDEFQVNTSTVDDQILPAVAMGASGNFLVVWQHPSEFGGAGIFGQLFDSGGNPLGSEFWVADTEGYSTSRRRGRWPGELRRRLAPERLRLFRIQHPRSAIRLGR